MSMGGSDECCLGNVWATERLNLAPGGIFQNHQSWPWGLTV